jgi:hypothetical protein
MENIKGNDHGDGGNLPCTNYTWEEGLDKLSKLDQDNGFYDPKFIRDMALCGGTGERVTEDNTVYDILTKQRQRIGGED